MADQLWTDFFTRTLKELRDSEAALRRHAELAGPHADGILRRVELLQQARESLDEAFDHFRRAGELGRTGIRPFLEEVEYMQECLWDFHRKFRLALLG